MWVPWEIAWPIWLPIAAAFALALSLPLGRVAYRLPRQLDSSLPTEISRLHRYYYLGLRVMAPVLATVCAWRFGATPAAVVAIVYVVVLLTLAWIDAETGFLPDIMTLSLLWLGLLVNLTGTFAPLADAVVGAAAGYLSLWLICGAFKLVTGRQGMGHGDFKLLAALGAWLGWMQLPSLLLIASLLALAVSLARRAIRHLNAGDAFSFGPYLAVVGIFALVKL